MASFFKLEDEEFQSILALETDSRNWQDYRAALDQVVAKVGLSSYLVGTIPEAFEKSLDTQVKFLVTSALPDSILVNIIYFDTAYKIFDYLRQRYEKATDDKDSMQVVTSPVEVVDMHVHSHENGPSVPLAEKRDGHRTTGDTIPAHTEPTQDQVDDETTKPPNPHATRAGPTRPVGTSHEPAAELLGEPGGGETAKVVSTSIEGQNSRMATDRADDAKSLGDDPSDKARDPVYEKVVRERRREAQVEGASTTTHSDVSNQVERGRVRARR